MPENYKTIGEVSEQLNIPTHVLRFWESKFKQIKPVKRRGGRRFYSDSDIEVIENVRIMLHVKGYTIKGAQKELTAKNQRFFIQHDQTTHDKKKANAETTTVTNSKLKEILNELKNAEKLIRNS